MTRPRRTRWWVLVAAVVLAAGVVVPGRADVAVAQDDDGLDLTGTTVYKVATDDGVVDVEIRLRATNRVPDQRRSNGIFRTWFTGTGVLIPTGAVDIGATRNGSAVSVTLEEQVGEQSGVSLGIYLVDFGPNVYFGQTADIVVRYRLPSSAPRSPGLARVNPAYTTIVPIPVGDPGQATVRIELPLFFRTEWTGAEFAETVVGLARVLEAADIADPFAWGAVVTARLDDELLRSTVAVDLDPVGTEQVVVAAWPDDPQWQEFVATGVTDGLPVLEELIGLEWPIEGDLTITETITPYLYGYAGWFSTSLDDDGTAAIEIGEDLDDQVLHHELSHAWFDREFVDARWFTEGLAELFAYRALDEQGIEYDAPAVADRTDEHGFALERWPAPFGENADEAEAYGYAASHTVVAELFDDIGDDRMRDVLEVLDAGLSPYDPDGEIPHGLNVPRWGQVLDAFELTGGSTAAAELFDEWVLDSIHEAVLDRRSSAQQQLAELTAAGGAWGVPDRIVRDMGRWNFGQVDRTAEVAHATIDTRDALWRRAAELDAELVDVGAPLYAAAEAPADFDDVVEVLGEQGLVLDELAAAAEAVAADEGLLERIGLWGEDPDEELAAVRSAIEDGDGHDAVERAIALRTLLADAEGVGTFRALVAGGALLGLLLLVSLTVVWRRRRRAHRPEESAEVPEGPEP